MCGVAGFFHRSSCSERAGKQLLAAMGKAIVHRGPDQGSEWIDPEAGVGVASRRLAIIDLSEAGNQPMQSASGRFVVAYNGEIYNHRELREELERSGKALAWRGTSDTETLLAAIEAWGLAATLKRATGMFALALWDRSDRTLRLARDRMGEKPLYYGWQGRGPGAVFLFGSELKALACHPAFEGDIDRDALSGYIKDGYVPGPRSIYRGISKLAPGAILTVDASGDVRAVEEYWSTSATIRRGFENQLAISEDEAVDRLEELLGAAVRKQLISDVPLGAFLSGGVDSSTIVAFMQRASGRGVQTFTIGFEDERFNEAPYARQVARLLGTDHHELTITARDVLNVVPLLPRIYDEPFADSSQIPTFMIAQLARRNVEVALTGEGADELFGGYDSYAHAARLSQWTRHVPHALRSGTASLLECVPAAAWNGLGKLARLNLHSTASDKALRGAAMLRARSPAEMRRALAQRWGEGVVIGGEHGPETDGAFAASAAEGLMAIDLQQYLPDDILVKVDRAAMAVSLETRAPFLDHSIVEFASRLPLSLKMRGRSSKWILRRVLSRYLPESLFNRPKQGFSIPTDEWLRGPLRSWAEELLSPSRLRDEGFLDPAPVQAAWQAHLSGKSNRQAQLWTILMFQAWLEDRGAPPTGELDARAARSEVTIS